MIISQLGSLSMASACKGLGCFTREAEIDFTTNRICSLTAVEHGSKKAGESLCCSE